MNPIIPPQFTLLCPGPVNVDSSVSEAYSRSALSHREEEFSRLLQKVQRGLLDIAGLDETEGGVALVITGSGTAANEAILASTVFSRCDGNRPQATASLVNDWLRYQEFTTRRCI